MDQERLESLLLVFAEQEMVSNVDFKNSVVYEMNLIVRATDECLSEILV